MRIIVPIRNSVRNLKRPSYGTVPANIVRMNDNSNLFMPNPAAKRVAKKFDFDSLSKYPPVAADDLRKAIGEKYDVSADQVLVGNGSDEIIDLIVKTFCDRGDKAAIPVPTFEMYSMYLTIAGAKIIACPLIPRFQLDVEKMLSNAPKLIFIASPNNPTGNTMRECDILRIIEESNSLVVIDEAYCEFSGGSKFTRKVDGYDNVIVLRTFSKAYALSGLRVGFAIASKPVADALRIAEPPFRLNRFSEQVAIEALKDDDFVAKTANIAASERKWISRELERLGAEVYPSETNFILFRSPIPAKRLISNLLRRGIAIRDCSSQPMLRDCVRVTFGRREMNRKFITEMKKVIWGHK